MLLKRKLSADNLYQFATLHLASLDVDSGADGTSVAYLPAATSPLSLDQNHVASHHILVRDCDTPESRRFGRTYERCQRRRIDGGVAVLLHDRPSSVTDLLAIPLA